MMSTGTHFYTVNLADIA